MGRDKQAYGFKYDDLDRLTESKYFDITDSYNSSNHQWSSSYSTDYKFNESSTYDVRGNILSLLRNGLNGGSWTTNGYTAATYGMIDNLGYTYGDSNRLMKVLDASYLNRGFKSINNINDRQYSYDKNGNLIQDVNKGITKIEYNYLNLPQVITFTGNRKIQFVYDASGVKLRKITVSNDTVTTYDYVNGVEYKNNILQRIAHTEGAVVRNEFDAYEHQYVLRDHLGNTRVTFRDGINKGEAYFDWTTYQYIDPNAGNTTGLNDGVITSADIMQINNYYPFGLNMEGNWNGAAGNNKYAYNGKEWNDDFGLGWNDYGARWYDPAIGRFPTVDLLSEVYRFQSPYAYAANNPINMIDFMGMGPVGADNQTNDQWMSASNPANHGSDAASTAYNGSRNAEATYGKKKAEGEYAASHYGARRAVTDDDIDASSGSSGSNIVWEGYRTSEVNVVTGFHFDCGCGGPNQPPCKGITYHYKRKRESESTGIRAPDFYNLNISAGWFIGWNGTFTLDRHWQFYMSVTGFTVGKSLTGVSGSLTGSWLIQSKKPTPNEMYNFLSGHGTSTTAGFIGGGTYSQSPTNYTGTQKAWGLGLVSPQIGISYNYTYDAFIWR